MPTTGITDGLEMRAYASDELPKIMYANTSAEYWTLQRALIHTDLTTGGVFPLPLTDTISYPENSRALFQYSVRFGEGRN